MLFGLAPAPSAGTHALLRALPRAAQPASISGVLLGPYHLPSSLPWGGDWGLTGTGVLMERAEAKRKPSVCLECLLQAISVPVRRDWDLLPCSMRDCKVRDFWGNFQMI